MAKSAKKPLRKNLVKELDTVFSQFIRLRFAVNEIAECVTCGKKDHWKKLQNGHFMSRSNYSTRWNEYNCQVQCVGCNVYRSGEQYKYSQYLGNKLAEELYIKSKEIIKFADVELIDMINYYKEKVNMFQKFS